MNQLATWVFSTLSTTRAISSSLTGAPLRQATITLRYSSALRMALAATSVTFSGVDVFSARYCSAL